MISMREKVFYVHEGMLKLTGNLKKAILLNALIEWTVNRGWFRKSYEEMSKELIGMVSVNTIARYCYEFEERKFLFSKDPEDRDFDRTKWHKANIEKIREELNQLGYELQTDGGIYDGKYSVRSSH